LKLVVGLGNPGRSYRWTRHNMGFLLVEQLARRHGIELSRRGLQSLYGRGRIGEEQVVLAKPQTYMNLSGEAVDRLLRFFKIPPEDLIVLHDDLDLPPGNVRIRRRGGHGGHRGVKSIIERLGREDFLRVKIGIGRPTNLEQDPTDFVLAPLSKAEKEAFGQQIEKSAEVVELLIREGPETAMNRFHERQEKE
jgi:PTH1 family peptidyl-tRNA hydrolase